MPFDPDAYLRETEGRPPRLPAAPKSEVEPEPAKPKAGKDESALYSFGRGAAQGAVFDPIEGIGQLVEWAAGRKIPMPTAVRNWLKEVRDETEKTTAGTAGRVAGTVASLAVAPEAAAGAKAASIGYRASRMTGSELANLSKRLGRPETLKRINDYAGAVGKTGRQLTNDEIAEALLGHVPGQPWRTLSAPARVAVGAGTAATRPVEGSPENFLEQKGYQALTGGALGGLAGSALARAGGKMVRPSLHSWHYPLGGYGLYHLLGPWGVGAGAGTLATLAALARGGGARSVSGLGGMAGEAVRGLTREEAPDAEAD